MFIICPPTDISLIEMKRTLNVSWTIFSVFSSFPTYVNSLNSPKAYYEMARETTIAENMWHERNFSNMRRAHVANWRWRLSWKVIVKLHGKVILIHNKLKWNSFSFRYMEYRAFSFHWELVLHKVVKKNLICEILECEWKQKIGVYI